MEKLSFLRSCLKFLKFYRGIQTYQGYKPLSVQISPTNRCNLRCRMCFVWRKPQSPIELSTKRILSLLDELQNLGTRLIHFCGGEPTLRADFPRIVRHAKALGFQVNMNTNGTLMTQTLAEALVDAGMDFIYFSVDAPNPELHDKIRGVPGAWKRTIQGIQYLDSARKEIKAKTGLGLWAVIMKPNYKTIHRILDLPIDYDDACFSPFIECGPLVPVSLLKLSLDEIMDFNRESAPRIFEKASGPDCEHLRRRRDPSILAYPFGKTLKEIRRYLDISWHASRLYAHTYCFLPYFHAEILPNGDVVPCLIGHFSGNDFVLGNIMKASFKDIWRGKKAVAFRRLCKPPKLSACKLYCQTQMQENNLRTMQVFSKMGVIILPKLLLRIRRSFLREMRK